MNAAAPIPRDVAGQGQIGSAIDEWARKQIEIGQKAAKVDAERAVLHSLASAYRMPLVRCFDATERPSVAREGWKAALYLAHIRSLDLTNYDERVTLELEVIILPVDQQGRLLNRCLERQILRDANAALKPSPRELAELIAQFATAAEQHATDALARVDYASIQEHVKYESTYQALPSMFGIRGSAFTSLAKPFYAALTDLQRTTESAWGKWARHLDPTLLSICKRHGDPLERPSLPALARVQRLSQRDQKTLASKLTAHPALSHEISALNTSLARIKALAKSQDAVDLNALIPAQARFSASTLEQRSLVGHGLPEAYVEFVGSLPHALVKKHFGDGSFAFAAGKFPDRLLPKSENQLPLAVEVGRAARMLDDCVKIGTSNRSPLFRCLVESSLGLKELHEVLSTSETPCPGGHLSNLLAEVAVRCGDYELQAELSARMSRLPFEQLVEFDSRLSAFPEKDDVLDEPLPAGMGYPSGTSPRGLIEDWRAKLAACAAPVAEAGPVPAARSVSARP